MLAETDEYKVVERRALQKIVREQKMQLSGLTQEGNAVELGNLLNAEAMLVGSYSINEESLNITGRIVDVEQGKVRTSTSVSGYYEGNIQPILSDFYYSLTDRRPTNMVISQLSMLEERIARLEDSRGERGAEDRSSSEVTEKLKRQIEQLKEEKNKLRNKLEETAKSTAVETRLELLTTMNEEAAAQSALALQAEFKQNNKKALEYLESLTNSSEEGMLDSGDVADSYFENYWNTPTVPWSPNVILFSTY